MTATSYAEQQAERVLPSLDNSNVISSYKNEDAARVIRLLMSELSLVRMERDRAREQAEAEEAEDAEDDVEEEAERIEQEAIAMSARQMQGPWQGMDPAVRLDYRMRARRKLGL